MRSESQYVKGDKIYDVQKAWRPKRVALWVILPLLAFVGLGIYAIFSGIGVEDDGVVNYQANGEIDYHIYLKDNDYYEEKVLGSNMQYIASLINIIRADFDYSFLPDDDLQVNYSYKVEAETKVTDRTDSSKVIYDASEELSSKEIKQSDDGDVSIRESVDIDYGKYNQRMQDFRSTFGVAADCQLILKLIVNLDGAFKDEEVLALNIPLSEQTVDITMDADTIEKSGTIGEAQKVYYVKHAPVVVVGAIMVVASLMLIGVVIYFYVTRFDGDVYEEALQKILKEYDTYIVQANDTIYEMPEVIRVESFKELLDAQNLEGTPILFLEVEPGNKSYFIVNGASVTYRFTLSRAYQERLRYGTTVDEEEELDEEGAE